MLTRHQTTHPAGHNVVPQVRVAAGNVTLLEMEYEWSGVKGVVPRVDMDVTSDLAEEKVYLVGVYQDGQGARRVATDSRVVRPGQATAESSADSILESQGWHRCFLVFQAFIHPGVVGPVEDANCTIQVFEHLSRPSDG